MKENKRERGMTNDLWGERRAGKAPSFLPPSWSPRGHCSWSSLSIFSSNRRGNATSGSSGVVGEQGGSRPAFPDPSRATGTRQPGSESNSSQCGHVKDSVEAELGRAGQRPLNYKYTIVRGPTIFSGSTLCVAQRRNTFSLFSVLAIPFILCYFNVTIWMLYIFMIIALEVLFTPLT